MMGPGGISPNGAVSLRTELVLQAFPGALTSGADKPNDTSQSRLLRYGDGRTRSWLDVVVHAEKIRGIVSPLDPGEPVLIRTVCCTSNRVAFVREVIAVGAFNQKRFHDLPTLARPADIAL